DIAGDVDKGARQQRTIGVDVIAADQPAERLVAGGYEPHFLAGGLELQVLALSGLEAETENARRRIDRVAIIEIGTVYLSELGMAGDAGVGREARIWNDV